MTKCVIIIRLKIALGGSMAKKIDFHQEGSQVVAYYEIIISKEEFKRFSLEAFRVFREAPRKESFASFLATKLEELEYSRVINEKPRRDKIFWRELKPGETQSLDLVENLVAHSGSRLFEPGSFLAERCLKMTPHCNPNIDPCTGRSRFADDNFPADGYECAEVEC